MGCPVADVINRAKFQLDRFMGFRAPDGRKSLSPIDLRHHPYNSYALPCYTVMYSFTHQCLILGDKQQITTMYLYHMLLQYWNILVTEYSNPISERIFHPYKTSETMISRFITEN